MLKDKVALVTGAASGIGRAVALVWAREGARVVVSDIHEEQGQETAALVRELGSEALFVRADAGSAADNEALVAQTLRNFGQRFLGLLYSPEVMAVRRLLVSEGGRANIGQRCWDMGPARGNAAINAFLQQGIERRLLRNADTEVMRHHLLALLEAELLPRFMFQHLPAPTAQEIALCTERAVDAFMRVYGTPGDTQGKSDAIRKPL